MNENEIKDTEALENSSVQINQQDYTENKQPCVDNCSSDEESSSVNESENTVGDEGSSTSGAPEGEENEPKKEKGFFAWLKRVFPSKRKLIQIYSALLFNSNLKGFTTGVIYQGPTKNLCTPGLNCYSCPGATTACPLGSLQNAMTSSDKSTIFYIFGILLLYAIIAGRWICGWLCPFGLIQELLYKIKTPKAKKSKFTRVLSYLKYVILIVFCILVPLLYAFRNVPVPGFCKYICPAGTLEGAIGLLSNQINESSLRMLGPLFTWKFILMISFIVGSVFIFRFFCRFFCPLGALYGLFNKISIFGIKLDKSKCTACGLCVNKCKMDIRTVGDQECIQCGECMDVCPTSAISWKGSQIFLKENEIGAPAPTENVDLTSIDSNENTAKTNTPPAKTKKTKTEKAKRVVKIIVLVLMIALLIGSFVYYNFIDKNPVTPTGNEVGNVCVGVDLQIIDGNGETGNTFNPATNKGKITVINFWGTWCGPCVKELPYFDKLASEYGDDVTVVAIHTTLVSQTAPGFIQSTYPDSSVIFALDTKSNPDDITAPDNYYNILGGTGAYPMTIILDENGVITHKFVGSLEEHELFEAVESVIK